MKPILLTLMLSAALPALSDEPADTATHRLDGVVVTGTRYQTDARHLPMTLSVVPRARLTEHYHDNILPTLSTQVPGLFVTTRGLLGYGVSTGAAGAIKVRGIGSNANLLVLIDGLPQYAGLYGHPIADAYQTMLAERVEVLRGPASAIYGSNAMGGVVNIVTRQAPDDGSSSQLTLQGGSYGTLEATATNRQRHGKLSTTAAASYGRTDGHRPNAAFSQASAFMKLGYDLNPHWQLAATTSLTRFKSANPGTVTQPMTDNDMRITRGMAALSLTNDYGRSSGAVRTFVNWGHHHIDDGYRPGEKPQTALYLHNDLMTGVAAYQSYRLLAGNRTTAGLDFVHYGGHAWNRAKADGSETDIARRTVNEVAGYVDVRQDLTPWMILNASLRLDHHAVSGSEWVPQGGLTLLLPAEATLKAMVSKGFRNATLRELYMFRPANANLEPERMMSYELSYRQHTGNRRATWGVSLFCLKAENMIETVMADGRPTNQNTGETENSGVELEGAWSPGKGFDLNANYSYLHTSRPLLGAPEHKLYVGGAWRQGRTRLSSGLQYVGGLYTGTGINAEKESFWLWNLTADYRVARHMQLFVKGENLLAQRYETVAGYPMPRATVMGGMTWSF